MKYDSRHFKNIYDGNHTLNSSRRLSASIAYLPRWIIIAINFNSNTNPTNHFKTNITLRNSFHFYVLSHKFLLQNTSENLFSFSKIKFSRPFRPNDLKKSFKMWKLNLFVGLRAKYTNTKCTERYQMKILIKDFLGKFRKTQWIPNELGTVWIVRIWNIENWQKSKKT